VVRVVLAHRLGTEGHADVLHVVLLALDFPFIATALEVHADIIVKQGGQLLQVGGIHAAKVGVFELANRLHVHQSLDIGAQFLDTAR